MSVADPDQPAMANRPALLEMKDVSKRFGHIEALTDVRFRVDEAKVVALLGDNGAGKSTLIKILSGIHQPDSGQILWQGQPVSFGSPHEAHERGISTVYQDLAVVDLMSVYRNMFLGREDAITRGVWPFRSLDRKRAIQETNTALAELGIHLRSAEETVARMSGGERQSIAIARGVHFSAKLLILDEPTSALSLKQSQRVLHSIESARERGLSIIFISHNVHHVFSVADRFVVLSHGRTIADVAREQCSIADLSDLIIRGQDALRFSKP
jgi:simple sugar transport system ATP-binding protein